MCAAPVAAAAHLCLGLGGGSPTPLLLLLLNRHRRLIIHPVHLLLVAVIHRLLLHRHIAIGALTVTTLASLAITGTRA